MTFTVSLVVTVDFFNPRKFVTLVKVLRLPFAPFPGLEFSGLGGDVPFIVEQVEYDLGDEAFTCTPVGDYGYDTDEEAEKVRLALMADGWIEPEPK